MDSDRHAVVSVSVQASPPPGVSTRSQPDLSGVSVHVSLESPAKIRNWDSPLRPQLAPTNPKKTNTCRGLQL